MTHQTSLDQDLRTALGEPFMTAHSGCEGGPFVKLKYETLAETQRAHTALCDFFREALTDPPRPDHAGVVSLQARYQEWMARVCEGDPTDLNERCARAAEEFFELMQSLHFPAASLSEVMAYTFARPVGEAPAEMGGAVSTLAALAEFVGLDMLACGETELLRVNTPEMIAKVRGKRSRRHGRGALPGLEADVVPASSAQAPDKAAEREGVEAAAYIGDQIFSRDAALASKPTGTEAGRGVGAAVADIAAERRRQVDAEGWSPAHDDSHTDGQMASAAACYALPQPKRWTLDASNNRPILDKLWPWTRMWWKPGERRRELVKAGALIVAEIERLDRRDGPATPTPPTPPTPDSTGPAGAIYEAVTQGFRNHDDAGNCGIDDPANVYVRKLRDSIVSTVSAALNPSAPIAAPVRDDGARETRKHPGRYLKEALFACLEANTGDKAYGGVLVAPGKFAHVRFTIEDAIPTPAGDVPGEAQTTLVSTAQGDVNEDTPRCYMCDEVIGSEPFHTHPLEGTIHERCCSGEAQTQEGGR